MEPTVNYNELFLRVQHWIVVNQDDRSTFERLPGPSVCHHVNKYTGTTTLDLLQCQIRHVGARSSCRTCSILYRCPKCSVEFESDAIHLEDRKVAVIITKWMNMEHGDSPADPHWRRHCPSHSHGPPSTSKGWLGLNRLYESRVGRSQERATRENASLLCGDSFRTRLQHVAGFRMWRDQV